MLMKDDKNKMASVIVASMGKKPGESEESEMAPEVDGVEQDDSVGMESAAEELLAAVEQKSVKGIVEAFKAMYEMYEAGESED